MATTRTWTVTLVDEQTAVVQSYPPDATDDEIRAQFGLTPDFVRVPDDQRPEHFRAPWVMLAKKT